MLLACLFLFRNLEIKKELVCIQLLLDDLISSQSEYDVKYLGCQKRPF